MRRYIYLLIVVCFISNQLVNAKSILPIPTIEKKQNTYQKITSDILFANDGLPSIDKKVFADFSMRLKKQYGISVLMTPNVESTKYHIRPLKEKGILYRLTVKDSILIEANTSAGLDAAFTTLLQLINTQKGKLVITQTEISDNPLVDKRILKLDLTNGIPELSVIKRQVSLMQLLKLNQLVLILSNNDMCLFPFEGLPEIYQTYSRSELKQLADFAALKQITVVPEISIPVTKWVTDIKPEIGIELKDGLSLPNIHSNSTWRSIAAIVTDLKEVFTDSMVILSATGVELPKPYTELLNSMSGDDWQTIMCNKLVEVAQETNSVFVLDEDAYRPVDKQRLIVRTKSNEIVEMMVGHNLPVYAGDAIILDNSWDEKAIFNDDLFSKENVLKKLKGVEISVSPTWYKEENMECRIWPAAFDGAQLFWSGVPELSISKYTSLKDKYSIKLEKLGALHLTAPNTILREVAGTENIIPLMVLLQTLEPVEDASNELTFSDAAIMEPYGARSFNSSLREFLISGKSEKNFLYVRDMLQVWINNSINLQHYFNTHPELKELKELSDALTEIAQIGDQALYSSVKAKTPKKSWVKESREKLEKYKKPKAGMKFAILDGIIGLLQFSEEHDVIEF